jgi:hypothetical protein
MTRCTFKQGQYNCGSFAFNLYKEDIDQGKYCDHHYWQDRAMKARADEREACERAIEELLPDADRGDCAAAIRARGQA